MRLPDGALVRAARGRTDVRSRSLATTVARVEAPTCGDLWRQPKREWLLPQVLQPGHHRGPSALGEVEEDEWPTGSAGHAWCTEQLGVAQAMEAKHLGAGGCVIVW